MPIEQKRAWCKTCEDYRLFARHQFGNGNGCLMTLITGFIFLPFWFMFRVADGLRPFRCQICGGKPSYRWFRKRRVEVQAQPQVVVINKIVVGSSPAPQPAPFDRVIRSKVVGITQTNDDGLPRQELAKRCRPGMELIARPEPENSFDENAIGLWVTGKGREMQLGYINADLAESLSSVFRMGGGLKVQVIEVTGGSDGRFFGVNIAIEQVAAGATPIAVAPPSKPRRPPVDYGALVKTMYQSLVDLKGSVIETYGALPDWGKPIVWGLGCASPIISIMFALRWLKG